MSQITVRLAQDSDNQKILELAKRCPQEGMITFYPNRAPQFNAIHRLLDPNAWHMLACKDDEIIGQVGVVHFQARVLGKICKAAYMLDLRLDKEYRKGVAAYRLIKAAMDRLLNSDVDLLIVNFLKNNPHPLVFTEGRGGLPQSQYLGDNKVFNIIPLRYMDVGNRFEIDELNEEDIPEVIELYSRYTQAHKIAPFINRNLFERYIGSVEGLGLQNFLVAREDGKIKAVTAFWDEHAYKSYQVLKVNSTTRMAMGGLKFLSLFMRVPPPIRLNEPLRQLSLVLYAHDSRPDALGALFRHVNNINLGSDYTLITLYAQSNDPVFDLLKGFISVTVNSEMHIFARDTNLHKQLKDNPLPVMFDISMVL